MKKFLICLTALVILLSSTAIAEAKIVNDLELYYSAYLSYSTNCYYTRVDGGFQLFDANSNALSAVYSDLTSERGGLYYTYPDSETNNIGLLDAQGQILSNPIYRNITFLNDNWALAYVLEYNDENSDDFQNQEKKYTEYTDVLYQGNVIGSLSSDEYNPSLTSGVTVDYLYIKDESSSSGFFIDRNFNITHVPENFSSMEFKYVHQKGVFHNPTQQWAFTAGCTLTKADVRCPVFYDENAGKLLDLQGNVIKSGILYDQVEAASSFSVRSASDYVLIKDNGLYGVIDLSGNIIIEPIYKSISNTYGLFTNDYQTALTPEGHLHFIDKQGNISAKAELLLDESDYRGLHRNTNFVVVNHSDKRIIISATHGILPTIYQDASIPLLSERLISVQQNSFWGAIDMAGNTVIPFIHEAPLSFSHDSTLATGYDIHWTEHVYKISYSDDVVKVSTNLATSGQSSTIFEANTVTTDNSWNCACGSQNTTKFCPECGAPKPVAETECVTCGYKPEGAAPNFCPECGTKF